MSACHCERSEAISLPNQIALSLTLLAMTFLSTIAVAEVSLNKTFADANKSYREGKFSEAASAYQKIADGGHASSALFYNLGNAFVKTGELGKAVLLYERALQENPRDPEVRSNLDYVRNLLSDKSEEEGIGALLGKISPAQWLSWRENALAFVGFLWVGAALGILGILVRQVKKGIILASCLLLGIALLLGGSLFFRSTLWTDPQAIILAKEAEVRYGPVLGESTAFTLHEGAKVRVLRSAGDWMQIYFAKGKVGWLPSETVERI